MASSSPILTGSGSDLECQVPEMGFATRMTRPLCRLLSLCLSSKDVEAEGSDHESAVAPRKKQIEDFRPGYPQFSSLISSHSSYHVCRRFGNLRARLLLLQQDRLCILESQLEEIDDTEPLAIFLGNARRDVNPARKQLLAEIAIELKYYDELVERNNKMLAYQPAQKRDVKSLRNWVENSSSIAAPETAYLSTEQDLLCLGATGDDPLIQVELFLENVVIFMYKLVGKHPTTDVSRDPYVFIFSSPVLKRMTRAFTAWIVILALLAPVVVINTSDRMAIRMSVIVVASAVIITLLALLTKIKTWELFMAGATYSAVMVVFVSGGTEWNF